MGRLVVDLGSVLGSLVPCCGVGSTLLESTIVGPHTGNETLVSLVLNQVTDKLIKRDKVSGFLIHPPSGSCGFCSRPAFLPSVENKQEPKGRNLAALSWLSHAWMPLLKPAAGN